MTATETGTAVAVAGTTATGTIRATARETRLGAGSRRLLHYPPKATPSRLVNVQPEPVDGLGRLFVRREKDDQLLVVRGEIERFAEQLGLVPGWVVERRTPRRGTT